MFFKKSAGAVSWLLVCLGNPGKQYENTRHNIGFLAADALEKRCGVKINKLRYRALSGEVRLAGQRVLVKILAIDRTDRDHIRVRASVKQAGENPYEKALRRYSVGNRYVGTVSMVDTTGVFVALDGGVDCLCSYPKRGRPPRGARVTVRILGINQETNRIWGVIVHIAVPH